LVSAVRFGLGHLFLGMTGHNQQGKQQAPFDDAQDVCRKPKTRDQIVILSDSEESPRKNSQISQ